MEPEIDVDLPTYTYCWELERKFWRIFEIELPRPVGLVEATTFAVTFVLMLAAAWLAGVSFGWGGVWLLILVPGAVAYLSNQRLDLFDGRQPHVWLLAQLRFLLWHPRHLARLEPAARSAHARIVVQAWQAAGADWMGARG